MSLGVLKTPETAGMWFLFAPDQREAIHARQINLLERRYFSRLPGHGGRGCQESISALGSCLGWERFKGFRRVV